MVWQRNLSSNASYPELRYTAFSLSPSYRLGFYWFFCLLFTFIPLILLAIFNSILVRTLFDAARLRRLMTSSEERNSAGSPGSRTSKRLLREQQWITKTLVTVVLVFVVCQLPGAMLLLSWSYNEITHATVCCL